MSPLTGHDEAATPLRRVGAEVGSQLGACYDEHGGALYRLANVICPVSELAELAVVNAFESAFEDSVGQPGPTRRTLARLTYLACTELHPVPQDLSSRALLALTLHGDHTYEQAASLLDMDASAAAISLQRTLRETAHAARLGSPEGGSTS